MQTVRLNANGLWIPCDISESGGSFALRFRYNVWLKDEVKAMEGARWDNKRKVWTVKRTARNMFVLQYLMGKPVMEPYDCPTKEIEPHRSLLRSHQRTGLGFLVTRKRCILAGEMGVGKTLMVFEAIEHLLRPGETIWYVAPRSALESVKAEYRKWNCRWPVEWMTYERMRRTVELWEDAPAPRIIIFDESSRLKSHKAKRSEAALHITQAQLTEYGDDSVCILLTGTPAPKDPCDWWMQAEIARPGFIREGDWFKFKRRYAIMKNVEIPGGHTFPKTVQWRDGSECILCKEWAEWQARDMPDVIAAAMKLETNPGCEACGGTGTVEDEITKLGKRLDGLVLKIRKKDCIDLPDKQYRVVQLQPSASVMRAAFVISQTAGHGGIALQKLRQLADGFQYQDDGTAIRGATPKDDVLRDILDEHSEVGRLVVYAGFRESVENVAAICKAEGWEPWVMYGGTHRAPLGMDFQQAYTEFQNPDKCEKMVFVAHPKSGGMGLTLTASPSILYYSNDFDGESRIQSEDRIHRIGMDENRGATIIDIFYLPTDELVLDALRRKENVQNITMARIKAVLK